MKRDAIEKIFSDKADKLEKLAKDIAPKFKEEDIHQFRVEVKRLRSLLRLLSINRKKEFKIPKKFKRLYDIAGEIREMQLEQKRLKELNANLPSYYIYMEDTINKQRQLWEKHYNKKAIDSLKEKLESFDIDNVDPKLMVDFINKKLKDLKTINEGEPDNEQIHTHRKEVKDMLYNIKLAEKEWKKGFEAIDKLSIKELDALSDVIGNYNDERIILDHLIGFSQSSKVPAEEQQRLFDFCSREMKKQILKKRALQDAIKKFVKSK
ncbi:MAG: CHAD domain-containing protein [Flavipsychrobacter sp.]